MIYYLHTIPEWLRNGELYKHLLNEIPNIIDYPNDFLDYISTEYSFSILENNNIKNLSNFIEVYHCSRYWKLYEYPKSIYIYSFLNLESVLNYLINQNNLDPDLIGYIDYKNYILNNKEKFEKLDIFKYLSSRKFIPYMLIRKNEFIKYIETEYNLDLEENNDIIFIRNELLKSINYSITFKLGNNQCQSTILLNRDFTLLIDNISIITKKFNFMINYEFYKDEQIYTTIVDLTKMINLIQHTNSFSIKDVVITNVILNKIGETKNIDIVLTEFTKYNFIKSLEYAIIRLQTKNFDDDVFNK